MATRRTKTIPFRTKEENDAKFAEIAANQDLERKHLGKIRTPKSVDNSFADMVHISIDQSSREKYFLRDFEIGKYPISNLVWDLVMYKDKLDDGASLEDLKEPDGRLPFEDPTLPKTNLTWMEAIQFCNRLSDLEGLERAYYSYDASKVGMAGHRVIVCDFDRNGYRLPSAAEREYAARGDNPQDHYGLDPADPERVNMPPEAIGWFKENSGGRIQPVGLLEPNDFGLHDMLGNVEEWLWDGVGYKRDDS